MGRRGTVEWAQKDAQMAQKAVEMERRRHYEALAKITALTFVNEKSGLENAKLIAENAALIAENTQLRAKRAAPAMDASRKKPKK